MNHLFPYQQNWQAYPITGSGDGEFSSGDLQTSGEKYLYHAVHIVDTGSDAGKIRLALDGERVDGSFITFDGTGDDSEILVVYAMVGKGMPFRNGGTTAIPLGSKIVGARRTGAPVEFGHVKAASFDPATEGSPTDAEVTEWFRAKGVVRSPAGAAHATLTNTAPADVIVEYGIAAGT